MDGWMDGWIVFTFYIKYGRMDGGWLMEDLEKKGKGMPGISPG